MYISLTEFSFNRIMNLSKKRFFSLLVFFFLIFPLLHAYIPIKCASTHSYFDQLRCGRFGVPVQFPFCGHPDPGFSLHCASLNETVLELPMSGTFFVRRINYEKQQITIDDTEDCMVKRLLTFNTSGSPFSYHPNVYYTFLTCPKEVGPIKTRYPQIDCLSNSTTSFFATSNLTLVASMLPACQIVKSVAVPAEFAFHDFGHFSTYINHVYLLLEWNSPDCRSCEKKYERCGLKNKASLQVKCFPEKTGTLSKKSQIQIITLCSIGGTVFATCIVIRIYKSERFVSQRRQNAAIAARVVTQQPREVVVIRALDQATIESYKTVQLGESRRLPGTNDIVCPICLSEYATKETVRCIPECEHCFHVECIDAWLRIHGSCPVCRNSRSPVVVV